jgi:hypothetical protein
MNRSVLVYAVALVLALTGAYWTWTHEEAPDLGESIVVLPGEPDELQRVSFTSDELELGLTRYQDDHGEYTWAEVAPVESEAQEAPEDPPDPHGEPKEKVTAASFKVGPKGEELWQQLAPFRARRELTGLDEAKLEELGLTEPDATLVIERNGRDPQTFSIAGMKYRNASAYVRDEQTGKVYVVESKFVQSLQSANHSLIDTSLIAPADNAIKTIAVTRDQTSLEFEQHHADDREAKYWSKAGSTEADPAAQSWAEKVLRVRASEYVPEADAPALEEAFRWTAEDIKGETTEVIMFRAQDEAGQTQWYAKSPHTRALVRLQPKTAGEVAADLEALIGGTARSNEAPAEPSGTPAEPAAGDPPT